MKTTTCPNQDFQIHGDPESLETACLWVRSSLYALLGPIQGELVFRKIPALQSLLIYARVMENAGEA